MNKRHYEHTLPNIRGSLSNTYLVLHHKTPRRSGKKEPTRGKIKILLTIKFNELWKKQVCSQ